MADAGSSAPMFRNALLSMLPPDALGAVVAKLSRVTLKSRDILYRADEPMEWVYFTETGMISLVLELEGGFQAEVGIVGVDGLLGAFLIAGIETAFSTAIVQLPGIAYRMDAASFRQTLQDHPAIRTLLERYAVTLLVQVAQTAACNGRHGLEARLARWLLMAHDCVEGDLLPVTQEFLAMMLGVHRPSITVASGTLQRAGLVRHAAGMITILDRKGLEGASCECYATVRRRVATIMGPG